MLQSVPAPRPTTNPYIVMLWQALGESGVTVLPFSWRTALLGRYDVLHLHWPENVIRGNGRARTAARQALMLLLVLRLRLTGTPVVRTLHNLDRHERSGRLETALLDQLDQLTRVLVALNPLSQSNTAADVRLVLHGHYRNWYANLPVVEKTFGRIAFVGLIRAYKGVEDLITGFRELIDPDLSLTVSGSPRTPELADELIRRAAGDERIELDLTYIPDDRLVQRITEAELVVFPYRSMHNSGAVLAALSLDRPVLVPANPITAALAAEVGPGWVVTFDGTLSADQLAAALGQVRTISRASRPDLSAREWFEAGRQHLEAYAAARS